MPGIRVAPLPSTPTFAASEVPDFGAVVSGFDPANASPEDYKEVEDLLYKHSILVFPGVKVEPETQYKLTKHFDPSAETYGHGNNKTGSEKKSILVRGGGPFRAYLSSTQTDLLSRNALPAPRPQDSPQPAPSPAHRQWRS